MAGFYHLDHKEVIRIKAKKFDGTAPPEYAILSVDTEVTSFEMLKGNLAQAFGINSDFTISYMPRDSKGKNIYVSMLSDWDMDAAFQCSADPYLKLRVDLRHFEELEDWDVIVPAEVPHHEATSSSDKPSLLGTITQNLGKTVVSMQRAMGFKHPDNEVFKPIKAQMSEMEFRNYQDSSGFVIKPDEFRLSVFQGGIEPSLRRVAWRHLLNIFPTHMSSRDRLRFLERKEEEYKKLRDSWQERFNNDTVMDEVKNVVCMVKKDVLRTDRTHEFYAGNDENANTSSLCNILVTYALTHPDISYCQGMSDLASPLLVTQKNEGQAYICFCSLMKRLRQNFTAEGSAIMTKFRHLTKLLCMYDPILYNHLLQNSSEDLFFCYRWILLELKREFPFNDALNVLEVMWATLPASNSENELALVDPDYSIRLLSSSPCSPTVSFQHDTYARLLAMRRFGTLYQVSQSAKPITSPTPRSSANNNKSTETLLQFGDISRNRSVTSSFDSSREEEKNRSTDLSKIDNSKSNSVQRHSDSINRDLQFGKFNQESDDNVNEEHNTEDNRNLVFGCQGDNVNNDLFWDFTDSYYSCGTRNDTLEVENCNKFPKLTRLNHGVNLENNRFHSAYSDGGMDTGTRSWSMESFDSESSGSYQQQTQFELSVDSNTNNSTGSSGVTTDQNNFISSTGSSEPDSEMNNLKYDKTESQNMESSKMNKNQGIFQSRHQLLTSHKQQRISNQLLTTPKQQPISNQLLTTPKQQPISNQLLTTPKQQPISKQLLITPKQQPISNQLPTTPKQQPISNQLLTTSKQQPISITQQDTGNLPSVVPKKPSSLASGHLPLNLAMPKGTQPSKKLSDSHISDCQEATEEYDNPENTCSSLTHTTVQYPSKLPPPHELGLGNPFLMFLCLTLLIQHRETILGQEMCYEEIAMHFDRLVRRHDANRALHFARQIYTEYLKAQQTNLENEDEEELGLNS